MEWSSPKSAAAAAAAAYLQQQEAMNVKPLRSLSPMFPASLGLSSFSPQAASPFICVTPYASSPGLESDFTAGFASFCPSAFGRGNDMARSRKNNIARETHKTNKGHVHKDVLQTPPSAAAASNIKIEQPVPLRSFPMGNLPPGEESINFEHRKLKHKRPKRIPDKYQELVPQCSDSQSRDSVEVVLVTFDALRRRLLQLDGAKEANNRAVAKAATIMIENDLRANKVKRVGPIPGVEVGDIFFCRIEMCLVGLHSHSVRGIDYMMARFDGDDEDDHVAVCIVSSGGYDNEDGDVDSLVYTGQGSTGKDDQKLEGGNLAMERSLRRGNDVRVIRAVMDSIPSGKVYVYDGLYKITKSWVEKAKSGFNAFKYKMVRDPGQPDGLAIWKRTAMWKQDPMSRSHVILSDLTSGMENLPVCLVNDVDNDKGPSHFMYLTRPEHENQVSSMEPRSNGCACSSACNQADASCLCAQRNGGYLPYCLNGILVSHKRVIYECGTLCQCSSKCKNRSTQKGISLHFEVFKTRDRGWALRSWDAIRAGTFICEYSGEVIDRVTDDIDDDGEEDDYIFRATCTDDKAFKWNYIPELLGESASSDLAMDVNPVSITISAKKKGNISRFINHSCSPNVFWQVVQRDDKHPHIMFIAIKDIPPMAELTYDYSSSGAEFSKLEIGSTNGHRGVKKCYCGSPNCRGVFG